jgi:two-component system NtrC family sensor kinase
MDRTDLDTYDLVLLDMKMPGIDGAELFDRLRQLPGDIASKVVFLTGDTANIATQEFIERTGSPVLGKPFTLEQLVDTVDRFAAGLRGPEST